MFGGKQIFTVIGHAAFTVKRQSVQRAVPRQRTADRPEQVINVVIGRQIVQRLQPAFFAPQRRFISADGDHIKVRLTAVHVAQHLLAQFTVIHDMPFEFDVRVRFFKLAGHLLHDRHIAVGDGGDFYHGLRLRAGAERQRQQHTEDASVKKT